MRSVTNDINEMIRRYDGLPKILQLQHRIDNWKGDDILAISTTLIHSGKLNKISKGHSQERMFYLFDKQLIYCKEDNLARGLKLKGRILLDSENVIRDLKDEEVSFNNVPLKNSWKIINDCKGNYP